MEKKNVTYDDFILNVNPEYHEFVARTRELLFKRGCVEKIDQAKNGQLVSYSDKNKRVILNFVFRKSGLITRIYGDFVNQYPDFMETLPDGMTKAIEKAPVCKRLIDITKCNPRCRMGYDFNLKSARQQKCRYSCFMFPVNHEDIPFIEAFIASELNAREAVHDKSL